MAKKNAVYKANERRALRSALAHMFIGATASNGQRHAPVLGEFESFVHRMRKAHDDPDVEVINALHEWLLESLSFVDCNHKMPALGERCELCGYARKKGWKWDKTKKKAPSESARKRSSGGSK